ncbi:phytochrome-like protein cph2 [mine drainage metagenome]|uniref:Phytochrome-like protein cph2 n=1 Tax=mine drainage metagenome TaxID=410659 RepID=A0A1J5PBR1_9ZZZZ
MALLSVNKREHSAIVAQKLLAALKPGFTIESIDIHVGASMGISVFPEDGMDTGMLLQLAGVAVKRLKPEDESAYLFYSTEMNQRAKERWQLEGELRQALASQQLLLHYQPKVSLRNGRIVGAEALIRWKHPEKGMISPGSFIPMAEETGLILDIGQWVLHEACRQMKEWLDAGIAPPLIAVNVSGRQFKNAREIEQDIAGILVETALPPGLLELELTESVLVEVSREHDDVLQRLRGVGLHIAIDDFGTGYSSLEYLGRLPVNRIKIAQSFMLGLVAGSSNATIVKTAIGMAHELGLDVVVEGVETAEQLELIKSFNGRNIQGYYYCRPLAAAAATAVLQTGTILPARPVSAVGTSE